MENVKSSHSGEDDQSGIVERPRKSPYEMVSYQYALNSILKETIGLEANYKSFKSCLGYILAQPIVADKPFPPFPASVKDGYAVLADDGCEIKQVIGGFTPGSQAPLRVTHGTCVRVSTGGVIPEGADAVVQVEDTVIHKTDGVQEIEIKFLQNPKVGQDIRAVGSDITVGETVIEANKLVTSIEMGLFAANSILGAHVYEKPKVAILSTGDEIVDLESPVPPGCIRDSNKITLISFLVENKIPCEDIGIARDIASDVRDKLQTAFKKCDVIVTTGGVSMGEKDMVKRVLIADFNADIHFGRIRMKPGKPMTFSTLVYQNKKKYVFSLPGNPVSAFVCFYLFVLPCIKKLMGFKELMHSIKQVKLSHNICLDERPEFQRAIVSVDTEGQLRAKSTGQQQSSRFMSMSGANAFLVLPPKSEEEMILPADSLVDAMLIQPFQKVI